MLAIRECLLDVCIVNAVGLFLVFSCRALTRKMGIRSPNDALGSSFNVAGTIYAVLLGFMLYQFWSQFDETQRNVEVEAETLVSVSRVAEQLPPPIPEKFKQALASYARAVTESDFPAMAHGNISPEGIAASKAVWHLLEEIKPHNDGEKMYLDHLVGCMQDLLRSRRMRETRARTDIPQTTWLVLYVGAFIIILYGCLFEVDSSFVHALKIAGLSSMIGISMFAISEMSTPFSGAVTVSSRSFTEVAQRLSEP